MSQQESTGQFDGKDCCFVLADDELHVKLPGDITHTIDLNSVVAITKGEKDEDSHLHLFQSNGKDDSSPKDLVYESHQARKLPVSLDKDFTVKELPGALRLAPLRFWIVISTLSGTSQASSFFKKALQPLLTALGIKDYQLLETTSAKSIADFCKDQLLQNANSGVDQTVILLSGDGGPVDLINVLADGLDSSNATLPAIGLVPLGTGNALAHSAGLTKDSTVGIRSLLRAYPQPMPTFQVTLSPGAAFVTDEGQSREKISKASDSLKALHGAVVCSWGFHASLVADSDTVEYRKFGAQRFGMAAKELLQPADGSAPHAYRGKVEVLTSGNGNGGHWKAVGGSEHAYTLLTLASKLEQAFTISPASRPLDGHLRLIHFGPVAPDEVMRLMTLAYQGGKHVEDSLVDYEDVEALKIRFEEEEERWRRICIDGKIVAVEKGGWIEVKKSQPVLSLLAPRS